MPVTYIVDTSRKLIQTTCTSPLTLADVIGHFRTLKDDPACVGQLDVLLDVSDADAVPGTDQLAAVGAEIAANRMKVQFRACAIVAKRDAMFGMMRVFAVTGERFFAAIQVFRGAAEAEAWLGSQRTAEGHPRY